MMMAIGRKIKTAYFCSECGAEHPRWQGKCRECGEWNSLIEEKKPVGRTPTVLAGSSQKQTIAEIDCSQVDGWTTGILELDRVLGGQLLPGMTILLGGEPGIGKSTLLLQAADAYARSGLEVLYVTGEESLPQIKLRAQRLGLVGDQVVVFSATSLEEIIDAVSGSKFKVVLIDSIQTVVSSGFDSPPGTVAQVRECAHRLIGLAKTGMFSLYLVGHVTKDGLVAGPKVLEHMVDTVIYFEGDSSHTYRILRPTKNRYGSTAEIGLFEMRPEGLVEVTNPSQMFLSEHDLRARTGSVVAAVCQGNRPLLVEVQALVSTASYGTPQRVAGGFDNKRLALLLAILEKRCGYQIGASDVFVSIAGGLRLSEPALDLPVMAAVVSSFLDRQLLPKIVAAGEVGLSGEVRGITMVDRRLSEAARMGFKQLVVPQTNLAQLGEKPIDVIGVASVQQALEALLEG